MLGLSYAFKLTAISHSNLCYIACIKWNHHFLQVSLCHCCYRPMTNLYHTCVWQLFVYILEKVPSIYLPSRITGGTTVLRLRFPDGEKSGGLLASRHAPLKTNVADTPGCRSFILVLAVYKDYPVFVKLISHLWTMETILEQQRRYHEEKERLMDAKTKEMLHKKSTVS